MEQAQTHAAEANGSAPDHAARRNLAKGGALSFIGSALSAGLGFALTVLITRLLGTEGAGVVFQATGAFSVVLAFAKVGLDSTANYLLPRVRLDNPRELRSVINAFLLLALGASLVLVLAVELAAPYLWNDSAEVTASVRAIAAFVPFGALFLILAAVLRALGSVRDYVLVANIGVPVLRPPLVAVAAVAATTSATVAVSLAWALPLLLCGAVAYVWVARRVAALEGELGEGEKSPALPPAQRWREIVGFAAPRTISAGLEQALVWVDVLFAGWLLSDHAAGIYGGASRFVQAGLLVDAALRVVVSPQFSSLLHRGKLDQVRELYLTATMWLVLIGSPVYVLLAFFAPVFLDLLGPGFREGGTALAILATGMTVSFLAGNIHSLLIMSGRSNWAAFNKLVVLAVNVGGNLLLMPRYGIVGAALMWSACMVLDAVLAAVEVRVFLGVRMEPLRVALPLAVVLGSFGVASAAALWLLGSGVGPLLAAAGVGLVIFCVACVRLRAPLHLDGLVGMFRQRAGRR